MEVKPCPTGQGPLVAAGSSARPGRGESALEVLQHQGLPVPAPRLSMAPPFSGVRRHGWDRLREPYGSGPQSVWLQGPVSWTREEGMALR